MPARRTIPISARVFLGLNFPNCARQLLALELELMSSGDQMSTNPIAYRAAIAEALMRDHHRSWDDAFETAEAISPTYMAEGISADVAALLWVRYTTRTALPASHDLRSAA